MQSTLSKWRETSNGHAAVNVNGISIHFLQTERHLSVQTRHSQVSQNDLSKQRRRFLVTQIKNIGMIQIPQRRRIFIGIYHFCINCIIQQRDRPLTGTHPSVILKRKLNDVSVYFPVYFIRCCMLQPDLPERSVQLTEKSRQSCHRSRKSAQLNRRSHKIHPHC